jgi:hypothetical protein
MKGDNSKMVFIRGRTDINFLVAIFLETTKAASRMIRGGDISVPLLVRIVPIPRERESLWALWTAIIKIFLRRRHIFTNLC